MAMSDYRLCDICGNKTFYDAELNYRQPKTPEENVRNDDIALDFLGDWAVICRDCAKTHRCIIEEISK